MSINIISLFVVFIAWTSAVLAELPPGITACPGSLALDQYNECVLEQLETITPLLVKGIPALKLPPMDPLALPSLVVDRNLEGLRVKANLTGVRVYGATNYKVNELRAKPNDLSVRMKVQFPHIYVKGNYDVKGNLLLLSLNGNGVFKGNFTNTQVRVIAGGREITDKKGIQRIQLDKLITKINVGHGNIELDAPQNQILTANAAAGFFNANPKLVLNIINPIIEETAASIGKALATRALGAVTKNEILP